MIRTRDEAEAHQRKHGFITDSIYSPPIGVGPRAPGEVVASKVKFKGSKQPNKTEEEFGNILRARQAKGEFVLVKFEAVKLRIGGNCFYSPDWLALPNMGAIPILTELSGGYTKPVFFEVKGAHIWDDSVVKFKAAVELHPWATFEMWQKKGGQWYRIH